MRYEIKATLVVGGLFALGLAYGIIKRTDFENQPTHTGWFEVLSLEHQKSIYATVRSTGDKNAPTYKFSFRCGFKEVIVRKGGAYPLDFKIVGAEGYKTLRFIDPESEFCGK